MNIVSKYDVKGSGTLSIFEFHKCVDELLQFQSMVGGPPPQQPVAAAQAVAKSAGVPGLGGLSGLRGGNRGGF